MLFLESRYPVVEVIDLAIKIISFLVPFSSFFLLPAEPALVLPFQSVDLLLQLINISSVEAEHLLHLEI